jgi:hypothetical protein
MRPDRPLADLLFNCVLPALLLARGTAWLGAGPALGAALAFPLVHAVWSRLAAARPSPLLPLALAGTAITGGLALFALPAGLYALKEAALPLLVALWLWTTASSPQSGLRGMLDRAVDLGAIEAALDPPRRAAWNAVWIGGARALAAVTALSGLVGAALAAAWIRSPGGSEAFNAELASYTAWSWPLVNLPSLLASGLVLWRTIAAAESVSGATLAERTGPT